MNENFQKWLALILASMNAGVVEVSIIRESYDALKAESGMTDQEIGEDTETRGNALEAKALKRLIEIG